MPTLQVESVRKAYNDGNHNAFTDLCRYRDRYYLTFRNCPDGHMLFTTSRILVLESDDTRTWREVCAFNVPERDVRDPHFMVFRDRLYVLSGTWLVDPTDWHSTDLNDHQGYAAWTEDGTSWQGPAPLDGTHGYYIWRAGARGDTAYLIGRCVRDWPGCRIARRCATPKPAAQERRRGALGTRRAHPAAVWRRDRLQFEPDGSSSHRPWRVSSAGQVPPVPPYTEWRRVARTQHRRADARALRRRYLVGGRRTIDPAKPRTVLYWLEDDALQEVAELPSGGDNSYPGFVALSPTRGLSPTPATRAAAPAWRPRRSTWRT